MNDKNFCIIFHFIPPLICPGLFFTGTLAG